MQTNTESSIEKFKVRKGKVRGYLEYLSEDEIFKMDEMINSTLNPIYNYNYYSKDKVKKSV